MTLTQEIREWLTKMGYQEPNPSEEALQMYVYLSFNLFYCFHTSKILFYSAFELQILIYFRLCRGAMGPIFQQIIANVKPRQEIDHIKKTMLLNQLVSKKIIKMKKLTVCIIK